MNAYAAMLYTRDMSNTQRSNTGNATLRVGELKALLANVSDEATVVIVDENFEDIGVACEVVNGASSDELNPTTLYIRMFDPGASASSQS